MAAICSTKESLQISFAASKLSLTYSLFWFGGVGMGSVSYYLTIAYTLGREPNTKSLIVAWGRALAISRPSQFLVDTGQEVRPDSLQDRQGL